MVRFLMCVCAIFCGAFFASNKNFADAIVADNAKLSTSLLAAFNNSDQAAWMVEEWTGQDKPYLLIEKKIDAAFASKKFTIADLKECEILSQSTPNNHWC